MVRNKINILGIDVNLIKKEELLINIGEIIKTKKKEMILNVNIHAINLAVQNSAFGQILNSAYITFCDGVGVKLGAKLMGYNIPEVITYEDFIWELSTYCEKMGYTVFLLGGYPGDAKIAKKKLLNKCPELKVVGTHHGFFNKSDSDQVITMINELKPDILLCCFGMPLQENWIHNNFQKIKSNVFLSAGGCIDIISGRVPIPPVWMKKIGLRWLFRFTYEPRRVFKRYIYGNQYFVFKVIKQRIKNGING